MVRILVADDMPGVREVVVSYLRSHPAQYEVVGEAADGLIALEQIRGLAPDIVIMDLHMPGLTGPEVIACIREEGNRVPVILCSGEGTGPTEPGLGWVFRLPKPFRFELLDAALYAAASLYETEGLRLFKGEV